MISWPFGDLPLFGFDLIMADPPWPFELWSEAGEKKSPQAQYETMTLDEIMELPVGHLADKNCVLFMWATWPILLNRLLPGISPAGMVMQRWGFRYATGGAWIKRTRMGKNAFGTGYRVRSACEPWLLGVNGDPEAPGASRARNVIAGLAREHSRKPAEAYTWAERYMPNARRLDLFSRQTRPGWTAWGREAGKFDEASGECEPIPLISSGS